MLSPPMSGPTPKSALILEHRLNITNQYDPHEASVGEDVSLSTSVNPGTNKASFTSAGKRNEKAGEDTKAPVLAAMRCGVQ